MCIAGDCRARHDALRHLGHCLLPDGEPLLQRYFDQYECDVAIVCAYLEGGHTQSAIAARAGLSVSRVSRIISMAEAKCKT
ncbi:MAG: sigma factor-like helix-turn-helix DNA-binding protein [Noviherbaspirillum sp.]